MNNINTPWRPKVGDRVIVVGNADPMNIGRAGITISDDGGPFLPLRVEYENGILEWFNLWDLSPFPTYTPPEQAQRKPWEVLREAAEIYAAEYGSSAPTYRRLLDVAQHFEAAAAPKPLSLTLAEAVRAFNDDTGASWNDVMDALAREESK